MESVGVADYLSMYEVSYCCDFTNSLYDLLTPYHGTLVSPPCFREVQRPLPS